MTDRLFIFAFGGIIGTVALLTLLAMFSFIVNEVNHVIFQRLAQ